MDLTRIMDKIADLLSYPTENRIEQTIPNHGQFRKPVRASGERKNRQNTQTKQKQCIDMRRGVDREHEKVLGKCRELTWLKGK